MLASIASFARSGRKPNVAAALRCRVACVATKPKGFLSAPAAARAVAGLPLGRQSSEHADGSGSTVPNIQFEDIAEDLGMTGIGMPELGDDWEEERLSKSKKNSRAKIAAPPQEKTPPPFPDDVLTSTDPRTLPRDQLVWAVGRAATLGLNDDRLWRRFGEAITTLGEAQLSPSEVCRLIQAFAYAPQGAPLDDTQLQKLLRSFARRVREYNDERLTRLIYGYGKLAAKRRLGTDKFLDFVASEVVERARTLRGWRKTRILRSVWHLKGTSDDFRIVLVGQVMEHVASLDSAAFRDFVPMVLELNFHQRAGVVDKLNTAYKRKLHGWRAPELLLRSGLDMALHDLMKTGTLATWLLRLHELGVAITLEDGAREQEMETSVREERLASTVTQNLQALKLVEMCLRHERPSQLATLPPQVQNLLSRARLAALEPPEDFDLLELPFVHAELRKLLKEVGVFLHPTIFGPYLLDLADPLGRVVLEWDTAWALYPPWRRWQHEAFARRKHFNLRKEGWRVLCLPLPAFQALQSREAKVDFIRQFIDAHELGYLLIAD